MSSQLNYETFLNTYLTGKKFTQLEIFEDLDVVDDDNTNNVFIEYSVLHKNEFIDYFNNTTSFFMEKLPFRQDKFVEVYDEFMTNYKRKDKESRYAVQLKLLYPKTVNTDKLRREFIKAFLHQLIEVKQIDLDDEDKKRIGKLDLPYTVEHIHGLHITYARITVLERKYLGRSNHKRYKETKYIDIRTGRFASRDCPDEFKKMSQKRGDYQKDRKGNFIKSDEFFSKNMRIFAFAKSASGRNLFNEFIYKIKVKFLNALKRTILKGLKVGKLLYKRQNKEEYCNIVRRRIGMINYAKETIPYTINLLLQHELTHDTVYEHFREEKGCVVYHTKTYHQLIGVFEKYRSRFKKEEFHDNNGELRHMKHVYQRIDELEENIRILIKMFFEEINRIELTVGGKE